MKTWYSVELENELAKTLRIWLKNHDIFYETSACSTFEAPRTHFEMFMDEETAKICQEFIDKL